MIYGIALLPQLLVAKNGRARKYINEALNLSGLAVQDMRAEDIPWLVAEELPQYFGLTTTEYVEEYRRREPGKSDLLLCRIIEWKDPICLWGKPYIAAIGKAGGEEEFRRKEQIIVAIRKSTELLSRDLADKYTSFFGYNRPFEVPLLQLRFKVLSGELEAAIPESIADLAIEVVSTGRTVREKYAGLEIYEPLFGIDLALVANKNYLSQLRGD